MIKKIISGGQNGADLAGLRAGRDLGLETGGTAPQGWRVCSFSGHDDANPELESYGLVQHHSREYSPRTIQNVVDSDATLWLGFKDSPGGKLTINTCGRKRKPVLINPWDHRPGFLKEWLRCCNVEILNVAGNRQSVDNPTIEQRVYDYLMRELG